jgi:glycosyltransferase involved in cell wall biosynthesis
MKVQVSQLPKLLYIGDVSVSNTVAGEALLYRLLQTYPLKQLQIIEGKTVAIPSTPETRLTRVAYHTLQGGNNRLLHSRFTSTYSVYLHLIARLRWRQVRQLVDDYKPEAILTVMHGFSWLTAAVVAKKHEIPLHIIIHDDWVSVNQMPNLFQPQIRKDFGEVYKQATKRYCVSAYMEEMYYHQYGVKGIILHCSRGYQSPEFDRPPDKINNSSKGITVAYAGSLHLQGYIASLIKLARFLQKFNGHLLIYSSFTEQMVSKVGLTENNIKLRPFIPAKQMVETLRKEADVLYAPMTFEKKYDINMQVAFPSKLAEYTATGLPILIWGPPYCSAVRWANENSGIAEVIDNPSIDSLEPAIRRLASNPQYRYQMGLKAIEVGKKYFSHAAVSQKFFANLANSEAIYQ